MYYLYHCELRFIDASLLNISKLGARADMPLWELIMLVKKINLIKVSEYGQINELDTNTLKNKIV